MRVVLPSPLAFGSLRALRACWSLAYPSGGARRFPDGRKFGKNLTLSEA
jgi:hypothetical protein